MLTPCEIRGAGLQRRRMVDDAPFQTPQKPQVGEMPWDGERVLGWWWDWQGCRERAELGWEGKWSRMGVLEIGICPSCHVMLILVSST